MRYRQIIFDVDGTLIDTKHAVMQSLQETLHTLTGTAPTLESLTFSLGIPGADALRKIEIADIPAAMTLWENNMEHYRHTVSIFDGIPEVLSQLTQSGYRLGVVTSETRTELAQDFGRLGLNPWFQTIICADDTPEHKPSPAPLFKYMELTKTAPGELLFIGDSSYDTRCAAGAGVDFALAGWGCFEDGLKADYYLKKPSDLLPLLIAPH